MPSSPDPAIAPRATLTDLPEWQALVEHAETMGRRHLRELFADDPARGTTMVLEAGDLVADLSKERLDATTIGLLVALARATGVEALRDAMYRGDPINLTEGRPVLHVALRAERGTTIEVDGRDVVAGVHEVLDAMAAFSHQVRAGEWTGATGRPVRNVVNIGIGGSDLGPRMAVHALAAHRDRGIQVRFASNVDGADLYEALWDLDPAETLVIVASKTFTTLETMTNARSARRWLLEGLRSQGVGVDGDAEREVVARHFVAISTNREATSEFGIDEANTFGFWDWVGGRYSLASAIGLPLMIAIGPDGFGELLAGMRTIDEHFRTAPLEENLPALAGLVDVWYRNLLDVPTHAVLPYSRHLALLPAYLQQLDMESNGKSVDRGGRPVDHDTGPVLWGQPGTDGQHAFFQLLHQGTEPVSVDLIGVASPTRPATGVDAPGLAAIDLDDHHDLLSANLIAQGEALAFGKTSEEVEAEGVPPETVPHRTFPGNRPTTTIVVPELTPSTLGQLIAFYEHRVFVQGAVWDVNSFDQWGVELGKVLANRIAAELTAPEDPDPAGHDSSTSDLIRRMREARRNQRSARA